MKTSKNENGIKTETEKRASMWRKIFEQHQGSGDINGVFHCYIFMRTTCNITWHNERKHMKLREVRAKNRVWPNGIIKQENRLFHKSRFARLRAGVSRKIRCVSGWAWKYTFSTNVTTNSTPPLILYIFADLTDFFSFFLSFIGKKSRRWFLISTSFRNGSTIFDRMLIRSDRRIVKTRKKKEKKKKNERQNTFILADKTNQQRGRGTSPWQQRVNTFVR